MKSIGRSLIGIILSASLAGCTGLISPGAAPTGAPGSAPAGGPSGFSSVQKEDGDDKVSAGDLPADVPPGGAPSGPPAGTPPPAGSPAPAGDAAVFGKIPMYAAVPDPHPAGVSALPADVDGGDKPRTPWDFTLTATADPYCEVASAADEEINRYDVKGIVGGVLRNGIRVPITSGCDLLTVRFNLGASKNTVQCQDLRVAEDCRFEGTITAPRYQQPTVYVIRATKSRDCADIGGIDARPDFQELDFMPRPPSEKLPICSAIQIKDSLGPQLKQFMVPVNPAGP